MYIDIAVLGAGIAGLGAAFKLNKNGLKCFIYEKLIVMVVCSKTSP